MKKGRNFHIGRILAHTEDFSVFIKQQIKIGLLFIEETRNPFTNVEAVN